ncbi:translation protein [Protomyces lactucae-debilis]|uniref:Large ribosomal subunit protein uL3m n=1 Tax=Protomyces lactucae-debilis TaxID=2754530 RepID=A0A1Y2F2Y9_PROLT|nr:translation protein [Protomyces lactucae-debilis]ORY78213.1 translation protein [Protomyces lactucae-debilis]
MLQRYAGCIRHMSTQLNPPLRQSTSPTAILGHSSAAALTRQQIPGRPGLLASKKGMTGLWDEAGKKVAVTILQLDRVQVLQCKTEQIHGYNAVQVGCGLRQPRNVNRAQLGEFAKSKVFPKEKVAEFRVLSHDVLKDSDGNEQYTPATQLLASHFSEGQFVDVRAVSKGKGFAGVMKRHGFKGLRASHGVSISHRSAGSMGQSQDPGRVLPGKKMAGRMGGERVTVQNVEVLKVDEEAGLIYLRGPVPGPNKAFVRLQDAIKKPMP